MPSDLFRGYHRQDMVHLSQFEFRQEKILTGHQRWVWDCAFSADSAYLVTGTLSYSYSVGFL